MSKVKFFIGLHLNSIGLAVLLYGLAFLVMIPIARNLTEAIDVISYSGGVVLIGAVVFFIGFLLVKNNWRHVN